MNYRVLAAIVLAELTTGLYLRWTLPSVWGPWALVAALFMVAGTFHVWSRLEGLMFRRRRQAGMTLLKTARDPWRSYDPFPAELAGRKAAATLDSSG